MYMTVPIYIYIYRCRDMQTLSQIFDPKTNCLKNVFWELFKKCKVEMS